MTRRARWCRRLTWLLVGVIAVLAFARSFEAIADYARDHGWGDLMCYVAPLLVDTFTIAAMLVILVRAWEHVRAVYAWVLLIAASVVSVALNVAHAEPDVSAQVLASLPPVALLAAVELAMSEARRDRGPGPVRGSAVDLLPAGQQRRAEDTARPRAATAPGSRSRSRQQATTPAPSWSVGRSVTPTQWVAVDRMLGEGRSALSIAKELGLSDRGYKNVRKRKAELVGRNGDRP